MGIVVVVVVVFIIIFVIIIVVETWHLGPLEKDWRKEPRAVGILRRRVAVSVLQFLATAAANVLRFAAPLRN